MSVIKDVAAAMFEGFSRLAKYRRDPCKVARRKERALIRATLRKHPNRRRVKRLEAEVEHWNKACKKKCRAERAK